MNVSPLKNEVNLCLYFYVYLYTCKSSSSTLWNLSWSTLCILILSGNCDDLGINFNCNIVPKVKYDSCICWKLCLPFCSISSSLKHRRGRTTNCKIRAASFYVLYYGSDVQVLQHAFFSLNILSTFMHSYFFSTFKNLAISAAWLSIIVVRIFWIRTLQDRPHATKNKKQQRTVRC